ncbi:MULTISPECIES: hypothetical protein [unclassified Nocardioides]|uniref:hypothetical protein n=1 Tax=unclassified Nocardioides TaxID=2615069 RepID=UPI00070295A6|nr:MULTISPECIES: hypothetical protein [unclassified Nocardioides]KRC56865.1 hypothetical protein ASE19_03410 [Nocardioides sp. Root79]KRC77074.1 hypothetical protein ASE20_02275 [Nocardioides sp. Root240]
MSVSARLLVPLVALAALLTGVPATSAAPAPVSTAVSTAATVPTTRVVIRVADCEGCEVFLQQGLRSSWWSSRVHRVHDGRAVFVVPSRHTRGMSVGITGTWEATSPHPSGFQSIVTLRYRGIAAGTRVTRAVASSKRYGSACFPGTTAERLVVPIQARKVRVPGNGGPALSTLAWASPQTRTMAGTMERTYRGVFGAQDVVPCF